MPTAEKWAERFKSWPAFFAQWPFLKRAQVHGGALMELGLVDVIERNLLVTGHWETHIEKALEKLLRPGDCFVDVGSNIGHFSLLASRLVGASGCVLAIEPCWQSLAKLARHLSLNAVENVYLLACASGAAVGDGGIAFLTGNNAGAATMRDTAVGQGRQRVLIEPLDDCLEGHGIRPNLVKIDVEGFELKALRGLQRCLARDRPIVLLELTPGFLQQAGDNAQQLLRFMAGHGYRCESLLDERRIEPGESGLEQLGQIDVVFLPAH